MATRRSTKKTTTRAKRRSVGFRAHLSIFGVIKSSPTWEANLEDNLVKEGFTRPKARELVKIAAS